MKTRAIIVLCAVALLGASGVAQARPGGGHGGHWHGRAHGYYYHRPHFFAGISILDAPLLLAPHYVAPAPAYYEPPVYIQQPQQAGAAAYWYYCPQSRAYYPYVQSCPGPWQRVAPQPPPG